MTLVRLGPVQGAVRVLVFDQQAGARVEHLPLVHQKLVPEVEVLEQSAAVVVVHRLQVRLLARRTEAVALDGKVHEAIEVTEVS